MKEFKNSDLVFITEGEFKGIRGKIEDSEGPVNSVRLSTTKKVANIPDEHLQKVSFVMKENEYKEYEKIIELINLDIKVIKN
ncbi:hypothetical protein [Bacillus bombysepticus]|uniref:hypothetical protein n=1 Tax=Bacillus bombysepticus TaxID=658666 RepID=UPI0030193E45|nr:hypothetical protein [Bacillus cereus]MDA2554708.1 hypothetical protein [Bacillus cereus]HDR8500175.1 hypothetical protein [Bacillus cereus]HDR8511544.1 hypothetical protein [Bacillus cereus]HDR8533755.1 hypothetical protein [Bacillus cereus]